MDVGGCEWLQLNAPKLNEWGSRLKKHTIYFHRFDAFEETNLKFERERERGRNLPLPFIANTTACLNKR